jgi:hypothetical protein
LSSIQPTPSPTIRHRGLIAMGQWNFMSRAVKARFGSCVR